MRSLCASVLVFEAIVIGLAIVPAIALADVDAGLAAAVGLTLMAACLLAAGLLRHRVGYALGWLLQAVMIGLGFVVPSMFVLGGIFTLLWLLAIRVGRQVESRAAPGVPPAAR